MEKSMKERIFDYRIEHDLSLIDFCKQCGISKSLLYNINSDNIKEPRNPRYKARIERFLAADSASKGE